MEKEPALDCVHYLGDRPCAHGLHCRCEHYRPMGTRVAVIKLAALGDVVRTACIADTIKSVYPQSQLTWISRPAGVRILTGHPSIDRLVEFTPETCFTLTQQHFDLVLSLDKEPAPAALCRALDCPDKRGMTLSRYGTVAPANPACSAYFALGLDDEQKFHVNTRSYPQLIHDAVELPYLRRPYRLFASQADFDHADALFAGQRALGAAIVGLNTGSGDVFAHKAPSPARWVEIARALLKDGYSIALLGGPGEAELNARLQSNLKSFATRVLHTGGHNSERQFTAIIDRCDAVVAGDTLAMHVAVARRKPVVALFGPTCHQEIDLFGRGIKLVSSSGCGPCYSRQCERHPSCVDRIEVSSIVAAVGAALKSVRGRDAQVAASKNLVTTDAHALAAGQ